MSGVKVSFKLVDNRIPEIRAKLPILTDQHVMSTAKLVEGEMKTSMSGTKSGLVYTRGGRSHQASAPGEAPAIDIGNLVNSIFSEKSGPGEALVGAHAEYGVYLEFGTSRMAPRPFLRPALEKAREFFMSGIEKLVNKL